ncbi:MAG: hypothetical protein RL123_708 [Pseudomonadota bacterium]|jgi:HlyD family secretion protein
MMKRLVPIVVFLLVAGALVWAFLPRAVAVETAEIARRDIVVRVEEDGIARIREVYVVSAPIGGQMGRIALHPGDAVVADETVLFSIRPAAPELLDARLRAVAEATAEAARAALALGESELRQAEVQLDLARSERARAEDLAARGALPLRDLERARIAAETAEAALAAAAALREMRARELDRAEAALIEDAAAGPDCCVEVRAPVGGRILRVLTESAQRVAPGTPLIEIGDPADIEIVAELLSRDAAQIAPGADVVVDNWGGDALSGVVRRIDPSAETRISALGIAEQRVPVVVDLIDPPAGAALGDGFRVVVRVTLWQGSDRIAVPLAALFRQGEAWAVFRIAQGRAMLRPVVIGRRDRTHAEVLEGLEAGARVVIHPPDTLADGGRVTFTD